MTATTETTIREIVAGDFRAAAVFHKFGIDFCCGGGRTVKDACSERALDTSEVLEAIGQATAAADAGTPRFGSWEPSTLISYIISNHHAYVREALPTLFAYTQKLAKVHGERHPELLEIARLFEGVADEMTSHMMKEEQILFPYINALSAAAKRGSGVPAAPFGSITNPIRMMEHEHESAGAAMARIRELSGGYTPPADGCTTYQVCFKELDAFERDLHAHVHLENNILFPKALELAGA